MSKLLIKDAFSLPLTPDLQICPIINGMWQVSGAHGSIKPKDAIDSMFRYFDVGFTTWDLADHYGPAEDLMGEFRRQLAEKRGKEALNRLQAFTKWVPRPANMTLSKVEENINLSLQRMKVDAIDLLQFHWWDYQNPNYLDALHYLSQLQTQGKIKHLALTNFDTEHLQIIAEAGIKIVSNQVQFSLLDRRPLEKMVKFCQAHQIKLLAYGTLAGGLFSSKYLGHPEPSFYSLNTASLRKYKRMIDAWGNWALFQELLSILQKIAKKHQVTIPNVAVRYVLEQPQVAGAIVGVRLGISDHLAETQQVFNFQLDQEDYQQLESIFKQSRNLMQSIGDCGDEYRR